MTEQTWAPANIKKMLKWRFHQYYFEKALHKQLRAAIMISAHRQMATGPTAKHQQHRNNFSISRLCIQNYTRINGKTFTATQIINDTQGQIYISL